MNEAAVEPQEQFIDDSPIEQIMDQIDAPAPSADNDQQEKPSVDRTVVPLSVAQKLREKKRELELELQWERQERQRILNQYQAPQAPKEDDNSRFESATREDLSKSQEEIVRIVEEKSWIKNNPEKYERVNEFLPQFLKQRPNLASAISQASNRYEEAYTLMEALTPKQQQQIRQASQPKKEAPNAPTSVPKAAALNHAEDVMNMSDSEFDAWKQSKKRSR